MNKTFYSIITVFLLSSLMAHGQIVLPGKTEFDKFLPAFWNQNSNASNTVAGLNAYSEIPFDNEMLPTVISNKTFDGTFTATNNPAIQFYDIGASAYTPFSFDITNGLPKTSNTVVRFRNLPSWTNTAAAWRTGLALGEQTTNTTAASWRSALALSENATNANLAIAAGTAGYVPLYTVTNTIGDSTLYKSGVEYGLDGGLRIGSTSGTAGDNNLVVDGTISVGTTVNTNYSFYAVNKGTNNGSIVLASKAVAVTDGVLLNGLEIFSYDNNITAPGRSTAFMRAYAASSHAAANVGSYISFGTATDATTNVLERLRIKASGDVDITTAAALLSVPSAHFGGTSTVGDNNIVVDGNAYTAGTNFANVIMGTNYLASDGTLGGTQTFTNYTTGSGGTGIVTNLWTFKNGLFITNIITQ